MTKGDLVETSPRRYIEVMSSSRERSSAIPSTLRLPLRVSRPLLFLLLLITIIPLGGSEATGPPKDEQDTTSAHARAIILFIGDGMGAEQRKAARWLSVGSSGQLAMDQLPIQGWSQTASANNLITDSAAGATAIATGQKTDNGKIAVDPVGVPLTTILEWALTRGWAAGLVTTTQISHATPAAFAAHVPDRNLMNEIALQLFDSGVQVLLGGGEDEFLPAGQPGCYPEDGERTDGRNLISEAVAAGTTYVCDQPGFETVIPSTTTRLLGLFADEGMPRPHTPTLADMADTAIQILSEDPEGFFLMVEGGQIDWAAHLNDAVNVMGDVLALDVALQIALDYQAIHPDTLVIITADHETGGMSADLSPTGDPEEDGPFHMPDSTPFYVNWTSIDHTAADVPVSSIGPWSGPLANTLDNTQLFFPMRNALDWWIWLPLINDN